MASNVCRKPQLRPILEVTPKTDLHVLCGRKLWAKGAQKLFGKAWGNSGKNLRLPKNLPAPTPMNCWIENFTSDSEKNLLDLAANQLNWEYSP